MKLMRCLKLFSLFCISPLIHADGVADKFPRLFNDPVIAADEILDPDVAFQISAYQSAADTLLISWEIEPGYYLYKDKFSIQTNTALIQLGDYQMPAGKAKVDPVFGQVEVYYGEGDVSVPLQRVDSAYNEFDIQIGYQGCKEDAVCYPPIKKNYTIKRTEFNNQVVSDVPKPVGNTLLSEQDSITQTLKDKNLLFNILSFFGFGFLLALTPCVFPMIPILSGIIVGEGKHITRTRAVSLSVSYVLAMASTYAVLGVLAGLFNLNLQIASQNVWVLGLFSAVFVMLALSMFGFYELQLPSAWQTTLSPEQTNLKRGTLRGAAIMGILSAIIVGPCVAPPLAGALLYISQTGDAILGGLALFTMGLGFGVPLLLVGVSSGELLPRAGAWMEVIKRIFGVIMLGVAIWFLERVLPSALILMLWAALLITTAVYMGALDRLDVDSDRWSRLWKGLGLVLLVYGVVLVVAAAKGGGTILNPFKSQGVEISHTATESLPFSYVASLDELNAELRSAEQAQQSVMLDFYADWCVVCKEMETYTFSEPEVRAALKDIRLLKVDVTKNNEQDKAILGHFRLFGPPAILFFKKGASEVKSHRLIGFIKAEAFVEHINLALSL